MNRSRLYVGAMLAAIYGGGAPLPGPRPRPPERPKTPADLERLAAAEAKRARRTAKGAGR